MGELKDAFKDTDDYKRRLAILTLSPHSIERTADFFGASAHMVKKSRELKRSYGILPEVQSMSRGRHRITEEVKLKVKRFYEDDEVSRMCPGKKDCISIRDENGEKVNVQKRLVLGSLREMYELYKTDDNNPDISFSSFAALRPKHCVLAGASGTHSVCVCTYHQNPALLLSALNCPGLTCEDLIDMAVCNSDNRDCMMGNCDQCPGEKGVVEYLTMLVQEEGDDVDGDVEVRYQQWESADRCTLSEMVLTLDESVTKLSKQIADLAQHHYEARAQAAYFKHLKESVADDEVVVQGDFSENYTFVVQDAVQGFWWDATQCTVHPFVVYWREDSIVQHQSFCVISDDTKHSATSVHAFIKHLVPFIQKKLPRLSKIHYFSDGSSAQYKNRYNFINVCHHAADFKGISCEWHFFATSHGKGACDGIGGTVKRATYRESLRRPVTNQILTAEDMFRFLTDKFRSSIEFVYVSGSEVEKVAADLRGRFATTVTIKGTRRSHRFSPIDCATMQVYRLSEDDLCRHVRVAKQV